MATRNIIFSLFIIFSSVILHGQTLPFACAGARTGYGVSGFENSVFAWSVDGGQIVDNYNDTIVVVWDYIGGNHSIEVVEQSQYGCFGVPVTATVEVRGIEKVDLNGDQFEICDEQLFVFDANGNYTSPVQYLWQDGSISSTYTTGVQEDVWVKITDGDGCVNYDSSSLVVHPLPAVDLGTDTSLCGQSTFYLDAGFYSSYRWSSGDIFNPLEVGSSGNDNDTIWVEVTDEHSCQSSDTIVILACKVDVYFGDMVNSITPNDDGANDTWVIPHVELFPEAILEIYDRWGRLIFQTRNVAGEPWDGRSQSGKEMPMDSYYYVLDLKYDYAEPLVGVVNVIR